MTEVKELPWIKTAESYLGLKEAAGSANNPTIISWTKGFARWIQQFYTKDSIPWCGLFVGHCFEANDIDPKLKNILSSIEWRGFGVKTDICYGCVMTFRRSGGGHVGFYVSEDAYTYHILGGNQSNSVNITRIAKDRFVTARWPAGFEHLKTPGRIVRTFDGKLSTNEA